MDTTETPTEKKGISRRAVIQGGAVGAAAFWTVPVIDSIASRAAAGSIPGLCTPGPLSWAYYFYMDSSNVVHLVSYAAGTCGTAASNPHGAFSTTTCNNGVFSIANFSGSADPSLFMYSGVTGANPTSGHPASLNDPAACSYFTISGNFLIVSAAGHTAGITLLGGIGFGAGSLHDLCATSQPCPET